jgi:hypothetical protein
LCASGAHNDGRTSAFLPTHDTPIQCGSQRQVLSGARLPPALISAPAAGVDRVPANAIRSLIHSSCMGFLHSPHARFDTFEELLLWTGMCTAKTCRDGCSPRGKWPGEGAWVGRCEQSRIIELCEHTSSLACHDRVCEPTRTTPEHVLIFDTSSCARVLRALTTNSNTHAVPRAPHLIIPQYHPHRTTSSTFLVAAHAWHAARRASEAREF